MNHLGEYHDLHMQSIFENFRNKFIEKYEHDPAYFLSAPGLT